MGRGGGTRIFRACMPPDAARLSPARGPAAANGDSGSGSPHHRKKTRRWTIAAVRKPFRQSARSATRRSALVRPWKGSVVAVEIVRLPQRWKRWKGSVILLYRARACFVSTLRIRTALLRFSGFGTFEAPPGTLPGATIPRAES